MPAERPTLADVARVAGVHVSIVSKILNDRPDVNVRDETRERIHVAARKLNYRPNAFARGLRTAQTKTAGILVPSLRNPVLATIVRAASRRAWEHGFVVAIAEDAEAEQDFLAIEAFEKLVMEGRIDGLFVLSARTNSPLVSRFHTYSVPTVFVNRRNPAGTHSVSMMEEEAGRLAAEHLIDLGHKAIAHIGPMRVDTAARRQVGFAQVCDQEGIIHLQKDVPFTEEGGRKAVRELLTLSNAPTAVFASNINLAIGAVAGARDAGAKIPGDLSLVGYDDDPIAEYLEVALTTVRMPLKELGRAGIDALLKEIGGEESDSVVVPTPPKLMVRDSTAATRG